MWELLRLQSNVELARPELEGTGTRRRIKPDVRVDGVNRASPRSDEPGRAALPRVEPVPSPGHPAREPIRFLIIDDPVQSMAPARVDGLARVLEEVGRNGR